jgi:hypothetical protein
LRPLPPSPTFSAWEFLLGGLSAKTAQRQQRLGARSPGNCRGPRQLLSHGSTDCAIPQCSKRGAVLFLEIQARTSTHPCFALASIAPGMDRRLISFLRPWLPREHHARLPNPFPYHSQETGFCGGPFAILLGNGMVRNRIPVSLTFEPCAPMVRVRNLATWMLRSLGDL